MVWSGQIDFDDVYPEHNEPVLLKGKLYRIVVPFLAGLLPFEISVSFAVVNSVALILLGFVVYRIILVATGDKRISLTAGVFYLLFRGVAVWGTAVLIDSFSHFVLLSMMLIAHKWRGDMNPLRCLVLSLLLTFSFLTNIYMIQLIIVISILEFVEYAKEKKDFIRFFVSKNFLKSIGIAALSIVSYAAFWLVVEPRLLYDVLGYFGYASSQNTVSDTVSILNTPNPVVFLPIMLSHLLINFEYVFWWIAIGSVQVLLVIKKDVLSDKRNRISMIAAITIVSWVNPLMRASDTHNVFVAFPFFILYASMGIIWFSDSIQETVNDLIPGANILQILILFGVFSLQVIMTNLGSRVMPIVVILFWFIVCGIVSIIVSADQSLLERETDFVVEGCIRHPNKMNSTS